MNRYDKLFGEGWAKVLLPFLESNEFKKIGQYLKKQVDAGNSVYPKFDRMFQAFKECPYEKLNAVWLTNNAYKSNMDGIAFSVTRESESDTPDALIKIFDAVEQDDARGLYLNRINDLTRWANQGVLLLNCDLHNEKGAKPGAFIELWKPFIEFLFARLRGFNTGLIYVLIGTEAAKYEEYIDGTANPIAKLEHPMLAVREKRPWKHKNIFSDINNTAVFINNVHIDWTMPYTDNEQQKFKNSGFKIQKL
jgi:uracil-DNA glycosylase